MLTSRQAKIVTLLLDSGSWMKGSIIAAYLKISTKTLQNEIKIINEYSSTKAQIISNRRLGYKVIDNHNFFLNKMQMENTQNMDPHGTYGRTKQIIMILLFANDYITIHEISERLYISKNSIDFNLKQIKRIISRIANIDLLISPSKGLKIECSENMKRLMCLKCIDRKVDYADILNIQEFNNVFIYVDRLYPSVCIELNKQEFIITGISYRNFVYYLAISIFRSQMGFLDEENNVSSIKNSLVDEISLIVKNKFDYTFSGIERYHISSFLYDLPLIKQSNNKEYFDTIKKFEHSINDRLGFQVSFNDEVTHMLSDNISKMKTRINRGSSNIGNYTKEFNVQYLLEVHILESLFVPLFDFKIPRYELDYFVFFIASIFKTYEIEYNILFVSDWDASVIYYVKEYLKVHLGISILKIECLPFYIYNQDISKYHKKNQIRLTTEGKLTIRDNSFKLIDILSIDVSIAQIKKNILNNEIKIKNELDSYYSTYLKKIKHYKINNNKLSDFYNEFKIEPYPISTINSIGDNVLCIISLCEYSDIAIYEIELDKHFSYNGKFIKKIFIVKYNKNVNIKEYFSFAKRRLNKFMSERHT